MDTIRIELTIDEANTILASLGQQPYLEVVDLIQKIQQQGAAQLNRVERVSNVGIETIENGSMASA